MAFLRTKRTVSRRSALCRSLPCRQCAASLFSCRDKRKRGSCEPRRFLFATKPNTQKIPLPAVKFAVIKKIVKLCSKFQPQPFCQFEAFEQAGIKVQNPRIAANRTRRISNRARYDGSRVTWAVNRVAVVKKGLTELESVVLTCVLRVKRSGQVRFTRRLKKEAAQLFVIIPGCDANWKSGLRCKNAGSLPAAEERSLDAIELGSGNLPDVAENKSMPRIVKRRSVCGVKIQWIERAFKARRIVQRFAERVSGLKLQSMRIALLQEYLQRVVIRVRDRVFTENIGEHGHAIHRAARCKS